MGELTKVVSVLVLIISSISAAIGWATDHPDTLTWGLRIGGVAIAVLSLGLFLALNFRRDLVPDYLKAIARKYFNRDGFCFVVVPTANDGIAYLNAFFQNQHDQRSIGRISLRPARGFFMTRQPIESISYEIECAPGAYGIARVALPIPEKLQGKMQQFEVGASVEYPDGKGKRVRFQDGLCLRTNASFGNAFHTGLQIAGAAGGMIIIKKPAKVKCRLPMGVAEDLPPDLPQESRTIWKIGDPMLASATKRGTV